MRQGNALPSEVSGPSAGQEIAAVSLMAENELGRVRQEAAEGSQRSFPVVLTLGARVNRSGGGACSHSAEFVLSRGMEGKCGSNSGNSLGDGLTPGAVLAP